VNIILRRIESHPARPVLRDMSRNRMCFTHSLFNSNNVAGSAALEEACVLY